MNNLIKKMTTDETDTWLKQKCYQNIKTFAVKCDSVHLCAIQVLILAEFGHYANTELFSSMYVLDHWNHTFNLPIIK